MDLTARVQALGDAERRQVAAVVAMHDAEAAVSAARRAWLTECEHHHRQWLKAYGEWVDAKADVGRAAASLDTLMRVTP